MNNNSHWEWFKNLPGSDDAIKNLFEVNQVKNNKPKLGQFIVLTRKSKGMSRRKLGLKSGVSDVAISNIESGKTKSPRSDVLISISKALEIDPSKLIDLLAEDLKTYCGGSNDVA